MSLPNITTNARGFDSLQQQVIPRELGDAEVEIRVLRNKIFVTLSVVNPVFRVSQSLQALQEGEVHAFHGREFYAGTLSRAVIV